MLKNSAVYQVIKLVRAHQEGRSHIRDLGCIGAHNQSPWPSGHHRIVQIGRPNAPVRIVVDQPVSRLRRKHTFTAVYS
jgi:hypothetical protein